MKVLKETLDALSRLGREWLQKLWLPYTILAVLAGVFVALLLKSCVATFFPLIEWWRLTGDWAMAMELANADVLWTSLTALSFVVLLGGSWFAHIAMSRVLRQYPVRELHGRKNALHLLMATGVMLVTAIVVWLPVVTLFLSAHATALSEVWDDAVTTPIWVWIGAFVAATLATFLCEWAMTLCRLMFKILPAREKVEE